MKGKTASHRSGRLGLTLVELLVVIGVVSVLTAIVLPSIKTVLTDRPQSKCLASQKSRIPIKMG